MQRYFKRGEEGGCDEQNKTVGLFWTSRWSTLSEAAVTLRGRFNPADDNVEKTRYTQKTQMVSHP